jgi:hypothetical protein
MDALIDTQRVIDDTRLWVEKAVIGLNLCPFAKPVYAKSLIRYAVSEARTPEALFADLQRELRLLADTPAAEVETTLLVHPYVLAAFLDFNDFLGIAEDAVGMMDLEGVLQVASFHPAYQFEGTRKDDITNFSNRSPYPTLHLLREASIEAALATHPDPDAIYRANIETLRRIGRTGWAALGIPGPRKPPRVS